VILLLNPTFKEELMPILHNFFQKIEEDGIHLNSFCEASITLIPKLDIGITRKLQTNISYNYRHTNPQQNTSKLNPATYIKDYTP